MLLVFLEEHYHGTAHHLDFAPKLVFYEHTQLSVALLYALLYVQAGIPLRKITRHV